jgi:hypothetical protein
MADTTVSIDPMEIIKTKLFKVILAYIVILQIVASQQKEETIFKNIFTRLFTTFLVLLGLEFNPIEATVYSLGITTVFFFLAEK